MRWALPMRMCSTATNVSSVTNTEAMFYHATSFKQTLCGAAWKNLKPGEQMFVHRIIIENMCVIICFLIVFNVVVKHRNYVKFILFVVLTN
jgi:hypothetical protein